MARLKVSELANQGEVNLETIRYYEREGLMRVSQRTTSGHRAYGPHDLLRLRFIKRSQALGFTLAEVRELLALKVTPNKPCTEVVRQIDAKALEVKAKIAHLQGIARALRKMKASCEGKCSVSECPILESLDSGSLS